MSRKLRPGEEYCPACQGDGHMDCQYPAHSSAAEEPSYGREGCEVCDGSGIVRPVAGGCASCGQNLNERVTHECPCGAFACATDWCQDEHRARRFPDGPPWGGNGARCPAAYVRYLASCSDPRDTEGIVRWRAGGVVALSLAALGDRMHARAAEAIGDWLSMAVPS